MNKLECEVCKSNDLVKDGDYFVCQLCGCKYTIDQVKNMMAGGIVSTEGKVSINTSDKIFNLYTIARRSRDNNDWDAAKKYYDLVLQEDPFSWEAIFYLAYFDAYYCTNGELEVKSIKMSNCITSVCDLINQSSMSLKDKYEAYSMLFGHVKIIADGLQERAKNFRNTMVGIKFISPTSLITAGRDQQTYYDTVVPMINCYYFFADGIEKVIDQFDEFPELREIMLTSWSTANKKLYSLFGNRLTDHNKKIINDYENKIAKHSGIRYQSNDSYNYGDHNLTYSDQNQPSIYDNQTNAPKEEKVDNKDGIMGIVFGGISIMTGFFIFAIIGLVKSNRALNKSNAKLGKIGRGLSIGGLIFGIIYWAIMIIYIIFYISLFNSLLY